MSYIYIYDLGFRIHEQDDISVYALAITSNVIISRLLTVHIDYLPSYFYF